MPTIKENQDFWDGVYDWRNRGQEWSRDWGSVEMQWHALLLPRIGSWLPAPTIVEIGCGYGRWTAYLKDKCANLIAVDVSAQCVEGCAARFRNHAHVRVTQNDGATLPTVTDNSVDFVFSFDALPLADVPTVDSYIMEIARVLRPGAGAFLHHSNLGAHRFREKLVAVPVLGRTLIRAGLLDGNLYWRDASVDAGSVAESARRHGLTCHSQEVFRWGTRWVYLDGFTVLYKSETDGGLTQFYRNRHFDRDARQYSALSRIYGRVERGGRGRLPKCAQDSGCTE